MIIGVDIDDTISDTYEVLVNYAQEYTIDVLKKEPIINMGNCDTHYYTQYLYDWKNGEDIDFLNQYYEKVIENVIPKTLAVKYLKRLHEEGNKIVLITARWVTDNFDVVQKTKEWIERYNIPCDKLIINAENKLIAAKEENVDVFIDDSFQNCKLLSENGIRTYMMDSRTNRNMKIENVERVFSWPHIYMKLRK